MASILKAATLVSAAVNNITTLAENTAVCTTYNDQYPNLLFSGLSPVPGTSVTGDWGITWTPTGDALTAITAETDPATPWITITYKSTDATPQTLADQVKVGALESIDAGSQKTFVVYAPFDFSKIQLEAQEVKIDIEFGYTTKAGVVTTVSSGNCPGKYFIADFSWAADCKDGYTDAEIADPKLPKCTKSDTTTLPRLPTCRMTGPAAVLNNPLWASKLNARFILDTHTQADVDAWMEMSCPAAQKNIAVDAQCPRPGCTAGACVNSSSCECSLNNPLGLTGPLCSIPPEEDEEEEKPDPTAGGSSAFATAASAALALVAAITLF